MTDTPELRSWSSLLEDERTALLLAYQPVANCNELTCSFDRKLSRMQAWLAEHGVTISEAEIRKKRTPTPEDKIA